MKSSKRPYAFLLIAALLLQGCGYHFGRGTGAVPLKATELYVPVFTNLTDEVAIEDMFTSAMRKTVADSSDARLVSKKYADGIIDGTIVSYSSVPVFFSASGTVSVYRLTITINVKLVQVITNKTLWEMNGFTESLDFYPINDPVLTKERERDTINLLATSMMQRAFDAMHSSF
ncbi:MAG: LPS assembly lipoprotein LptE [Deltaproteobacteria bacterium]|nr:LPS assembly lipoprotein LptE [Deltaproteobacteria bacterium]MCL5276787.1 LPS assembly lipoprotein LptE [Deltaproteobacteria bacterium]